MMNARTGRILPIGALLVGATIAISACGGTSSKDVSKLKQQGAELRSDSASLQKFVKQEADEVKAGTKTQEQADKEIQARTNKLEGKAKSAANTAIDAAESNSNIPSDAKKQLEDARKQLNSATQ
jgi:outer membrane murein-binding lipoprotein Lpp